MSHATNTATSTTTQTARYRGIRATDPQAGTGLRNPERGWRNETLIAEPPDGKAWGPSSHLAGRVPPVYDDRWWELDAARYEPFGLTLVQTYCYLDRFVDRPISDEKLVLLQNSLDRVRSRGLKALLRFAYETDMKRTRGPKLPTILDHLDQLAPIIRANSDVIYVLQAGFVGAWGEWHNSTHRLEEDHEALARIVEKLLSVLPEDRMTQVRVPKYKRWALRRSELSDYRTLTAGRAHDGSQVARIGYHDDGFLAETTDGGTWPEPPHYAGPGNPEFDLMTAESPYVPVDGELFWTDQDGRVDGFRAAERLRLHHYSSFSLAHSYSGREGRFLGIDAWMRTPITLQQVQAAKLPISDGYFHDSAGDEVSRTQFSYVTDHLGYRLELQSATFPKPARRGAEASVTIELVNRGFSAPDNPRPVILALIGPDERVVELPIPDADPRAWQPFEPGDTDFRPLTHRIDAMVRIPEVAPGWYQLGIWMPDASERLRNDPRYAVRVANGDVPWWTDSAGRYGINILGAVEVVR